MKNLKNACFFLLIALSSGTLLKAGENQMPLEENQTVSSHLPPGKEISSSTAQNNSSSKGSLPNFNLLEIKFVPVAYPNNKPDEDRISQIGFFEAGISDQRDNIPTCGTVPYVFSIGAYDITSREYCAFLNAVAKNSDPYGLYNKGMSLDPAVLCLERTLKEGRYYYSPVAGREELPITYVTLTSAARFCNWLHNGQPVGDEGDATTETGAYDLHGTMTGPLIRNEGAIYFIPNADEWYKAAYYNNTNEEYYDFPTRSYWTPKNSHNLLSSYNNEANYDGFDVGDGDLRLSPVGFFSTTMSPCGAFDMGGNVDQWTETPAKEDSSKVIVKGGSWQNDYKVNSFTNALDKFSKKHIDAQKAYNTVGFRVATKGIDPNASTFLSDVPDAMWLTPNETVSVALAGAVPLATVLWTTGAVGTGIVAASSGAAWCWEKMHCCAKRGSTLEEGAESNALATDHEGVELIAVHSGSAAPSQNVISIEPSNPSSLSVGTLIDKLRSCWTKKPAAVDQNIVSDVTTQEQVKGEVSAPPSPSAASHQMEPSDPSVVSAPTYWSAIKDKVSGYWTKEAVVIDPSTVSDVTTQESVSGNAIVPLSPSAVGHQVEPSDSSAVSAPTCWSAIKDKISGYWTKETAVADLNATSEAMAQEPAKGEIVVPSSPLVAGHQVESSDSSTVSAPTCWDKVKGCWTKETVTSDTSAQSDVTSQEVVKGEVTAPSSPSSSAHQADTENSGSNFKNSPSRDSLPHNTEEKRSVPPNSPTTASPETVVSELHVHQQHGEINLEAIETENTSVSSSSAIPSHSLSQEKSSEAEAKETLNSNVDSDQIIATHPEVAVQNRSQQTEQLSSPVNEKADHLVQIAPLQEVQSEELSDSHASSSTASTSKASGHKGKNNHKKK